MTKNQTNLVLKVLPVIILVSLSGMGIDKDDSFIGSLKNKLNGYNKDYFVEKAYLITDRNVYRPGEELWFKGFVASSGLSIPQSNSDDLFVKLLNSNGEEMINRRYPLTNNQTSGRLIIPRSSIPGKYWLVAYTGWMKNRCSREAFRKEILISKYYEKRFYVEAVFDQEVYYPNDTLQVRLKIIDPTGKPIPETDFEYSIGTFSEAVIKGTGQTDLHGVASFAETLTDVSETLVLMVEIKSRKLSGDYAIIIPAVTANPAVSFYPEGGNLICGLNSTLAICVSGTAGLPAMVSGEILDRLGRVIQYVQTDVNGRGKFSYTPPDDTCYFRITKPQGLSKLYPLPMAEKKGFIIHLLEPVSDSVKIRAVASDSLSHTTYWVAVMNQQIFWGKSVDFSNSAEVDIPVKGLPSGIIQVSVFDQNHALKAERLVNIHNESEQLMIKSDLPVYHSRQRVNLLAECSGTNSSIDMALSVSLKNLAYNSQSDDFNSMVQVNHCDLITPNPKIKDLTNDIDLMTTTYRSVYWQDVLEQDDAPGPYKRQDGLSGKVFDKKENASQHAKVRVTYIPNYRSYETQSDENGVFQINFGSDIIDFKYLNIDAYDAMGKVNLTTAIEESYFEELSSGLTGETDNKEQQKTSDVLSYGEPDLIYVLRYGPGKFRKSAPDPRKKYDPNHYANYKSVLDIIQDMKPYRLINDRIVFNDNEENNLPMGAIIVINGVLKGNHINVLENLSPSDITKISISTSLLEVQKYTSLNFDGVIEITTIQGMYRYRQSSFQFGNDILNTTREFYSPDYTAEVTNSVDNRKTLYWSPSLTLYPGKPLLISFFTSDIKGVYYCHLAGMDASGKHVEREYTFRVE